MTCCTPLLLLATAIASGHNSVQTPQSIPLTEVTATAPEPFSLIKGLRELSDGRVLVTDWIEERLVVIDFERQTVGDLGGVGAGPSEFRLPDRLVALPGDSTLLIDVGNGRLMVLDPELRFTRTISVREHGQNYSMTPRAADTDGALYFQLSPWWGGFEAGRKDSVPIGRWLPGNSVQMVGGTVLKASTSRGPGRSVGIPYIPFAKQDGWAAFLDGHVAIARSDPYRVEWYPPDGTPIIGASIAYAPRPVAREDRRAHVRAFLMGAAQSGRGEDGGMGHVTADQQSTKEIDRIVNEATFAEEFPPFVPGGVWGASEGLLWVQQALPAGSSPTFDVFDRSAARIAIVTLPQDRTVVGFGHATLYAVVADADDLLTLERYELPVLESSSPIHD